MSDCVDVSVCRFLVDEDDTATSPLVMERRPLCVCSGQGVNVVDCR